jgi:hypothetical protein
MSRSLPIPFKPIEDAIVIDGITKNEMLLIAMDVQRNIQSERSAAVNPKYLFSAAALGLSPGTLGALRNRIRDYFHAVKTLETTPDDIPALITVGALPAPLWNRVTANLNGLYPKTLLSVLNQGDCLSNMGAQDIYSVMHTLRMYEYDQYTPEWKGFINDATGDQYKRSTLKFLSYLGDKALKAADMFRSKKSLEDVRRELGLTNDTYAAWAIILGTRCQMALQEEQIPPSHWGNSHFINAYNARLTVGDTYIAQKMFTETALAEFVNNPFRQAYFRLKCGETAGIQLKP